MSRSKAILISYLGVLFFVALIFVGAGRLDFWQGRLYLGLALLGTTISHLLAPAGSTLTEDRAREAASGEGWDKRLLGAFFRASIVMMLVGGMDAGRFEWTGGVPMAVTIAGAGIMLAGQVLFAVARRQNAFFSSTVRLQAERGHTVCDRGVYRMVRHPGYAGMLLSVLAFPLVLNAYWAFVPALGAAAILVVRTRMEDQFLRQSLPGYDAYVQSTPWRLLPGVF